MHSARRSQETEEARFYGDLIHGTTPSVW
jgi:hypothetical protein